MRSQARGKRWRDEWRMVDGGKAVEKGDADWLTKGKTCTGVVPESLCDVTS